MADPTTVKRIRFEDVLAYDTYTYSNWLTKFAREPVFAVVDTDGVLIDFTEWLSELNLTHNTIDGEGAGRDLKTGDMVRVHVATKHDFQLKIVDGVPKDIAHEIFMLVYSRSNRQSFPLYWQHPCSTNGIRSGNFYCSTINYGAVRYSKSDKRCYYYGMNFKVIQI